MKIHRKDTFRYCSSSGCQKQARYLSIDVWLCKEHYKERHARSK